MLNTLIKEIKEQFGNKKIWIGLLIVLIIIIIGTYYSMEKSEEIAPDTLKLGIINKDDSTYSDLLLNYFNSSDTFTSLVTVITGEQQKVKDAFYQGELDIYLEIPENFAQNMMELNHSPIIVTINIEDTTKAILFQTILRSYEKYIAAVEANAVGLYDIMILDGMNRDLIHQTNVTVSLSMIFTALGKEELFQFYPIDTFPSTRVVEYYIISFLIMVVLYSGLYVGFRILKEIQQSTFLRIKTTQLPLYYFLLTKIFVMVGFLTIFIFSTLVIIGGFQVPVRVLLLSMVYSLFAVTFAVLLSAMFKTSQRFILVANLLLFYFVVIGGGIIPIRFLPEDMVLLAKITPNYYMMKGILLLKQEERLGEFYLIILGLLLLSLLLLIIQVLLLQRRSYAHEAV